MTESQKQWIDNSSYESLLHRWRNAPVGDKMFQGDTFEYFSKVMAKKRSEVSEEQHTATSKKIGWDGE